MVNFIIHVFSCVLLPCWIIFLSKWSFFLTGGVDIRPLRIQRKTQSTRTHLAPFVNRTSLWNELAKPSLVPKPVVWTRRTLHQLLPLTRNSFFGATSHFRPLSTEQALVGIRNRAPLCYLKPREWLTIWYSTSTYHSIADAIRHAN